MPDVTIRPRTVDDDGQIVDIRNRLRPEFPPVTVELHRHFLATLPPGTYHEQWVAERDGRVVGDATLSKDWWAQDPGVYEGQIRVDPDYRGQGIGRHLDQHILPRVSELGIAKLYSYVQEDDEHARQFAERRGFSPTGRSHRMSRLNVHEANLDGYEGLRERLQSDGLRVATVAEFADDQDFLHALYDLDMLSSQDEPSSERRGSIPFDTWLQHAFTGEGSSPTWSWVVLDGKTPVGMAILRRQGDTSAWNSYTGVHRDYRGRGVARALKLETIEWARQNGVDFIYTGNDIANHRMLSINVRLGYKPLPSGIEVVKHLTPLPPR